MRPVNMKVEPQATQGRENSGGTRSTASLGVRKRGDKKGKNKGPASAKIADALARLADEVQVERETEIAHCQVEEERAYEVSIAGVINHLNHIFEVVCQEDCFQDCAQLLMNNPSAREPFVAFKPKPDKLLRFLKRQCYSA